MIEKKELNNIMSVYVIKDGHRKANVYLSMCPASIL